MSGVQRCYRVPLLNRGGTDQEIISGESDAFGSLLAADLAGDLRCTFSDRMHRHVLLQFIDEQPSTAADLGRVGSRHSVDEFSECDRRDRDLDFSKGMPDRREQLLDRLAFVPLR